MEKLVIKPIEDQLDGMENLDRLSATAQEGTATVLARFRLDTDLNFETIDVQRRVNTARVYMPVDLDPPTVDKFSSASDPILEEALSSRSMTPAQLSDLISQRIVPDLKAISGVLDVQPAGSTLREIHVYPDQSRLLGSHATLLDLNNALGYNNANLPGGRLDSATQETTVSVHADIGRPADIAQIPLQVLNGSQGGLAQASLKIGDVATVDDGHVEQRLPSRYNGSSSILLDVQRQIDADTVKTTAATRAEMKKLAHDFPSVQFAEINASADYTKASVNGGPAKPDRGNRPNGHRDAAVLARLAQRGRRYDRNSVFAARNVHRHEALRLHARRYFADGPRAHDRYPRRRLDRRPREHHAASRHGANPRSMPQSTAEAKSGTRRSPLRSSTSSCFCRSRFSRESSANT